MSTLKKIVLVSILSSSLGSNSVANDFAKGNWLDSKQQILAKESRENHSRANSDQLIFKGDIADFTDSLIVYQFENNQLKTGFFDFNQQHIIYQNHINDFFAISKILQEKYGNAEKKQQFWQQQSQITDRKQWGNAIAAGSLSLQSQWSTEKSHIILQLSNIDSVVNQRLIYQVISQELNLDQQDF